jgi:hypothetical protein
LVVTDGFNNKHKLAQTEGEVLIIIAQQKKNDAWQL